MLNNINLEFLNKGLFSNVIKTDVIKFSLFSFMKPPSSSLNLTPSYQVSVQDDLLAITQVIYTQCVFVEWLLTWTYKALFNTIPFPFSVYNAGACYVIENTSQAFLETFYDLSFRHILHFLYCQTFKFHQQKIGKLL